MLSTTSFGVMALPVATAITLPAPLSIAPWLKTKYRMAKTV